MQAQDLTKFDLKSSRFLKEQISYLEKQYGLKLIRHVCCCPFHLDTTPSFSQYIDSKGTVRFKCFGCQINEDLFGIMMRLENGLGFNAAIARFKNYVMSNANGGSDEKQFTRTEVSF